MNERKNIATIHWTNQSPLGREIGIPQAPVNAPHSIPQPFDRQLHLGHTINAPLHFARLACSAVESPQAIDDNDLSNLIDGSVMSGRRPAIKGEFGSATVTGVNRPGFAGGDLV